MWIEGWQLWITKLGAHRCTGALWNNLTAAPRAHKWQVINLSDKFKSFWRPRVKCTQVWKWGTPRFGSGIHCLLAMRALSLSRARASPRVIPPPTSITPIPVLQRLTKPGPPATHCPSLPSCTNSKIKAETALDVILGMGHQMWGQHWKVKEL